MHYYCRLRLSWPDWKNLSRSQPTNAREREKKNKKFLECFLCSKKSLSLVRTPMHSNIIGDVLGDEFGRDIRGNYYELGKPHGIQWHQSRHPELGKHTLLESVQSVRGWHWSQTLFFFRWDCYSSKVSSHALVLHSRFVILACCIRPHEVERMRGPIGMHVVVEKFHDPYFRISMNVCSFVQAIHLWWKISQFIDPATCGSI